MANDNMENLVRPTRKSFLDNVSEEYESKQAPIKQIPVTVEKKTDVQPKRPTPRSLLNQELQINRRIEEQEVLDILQPSEQSEFQTSILTPTIQTEVPTTKEAGWIISEVEQTLGFAAQGVWNSIVALAESGADMIQEVIIDPAVYMINPEKYPEYEPYLLEKYGTTRLSLFNYVKGNFVESVPNEPITNPYVEYEQSAAHLADVLRIESFEPRTVGGRVVGNIGAMIGLIALTGGAGRLSQTGKAIASKYPTFYAFLSGIVASGIADPESDLGESVSTILKEENIGTNWPIVGKIVNVLAQSEEDSPLKRRVKVAAEDGLLGVALEVARLGVSGAKILGSQASQLVKESDEILISRYGKEEAAAIKEKFAFDSLPSSAAGVNIAKTDTVGEYLILFKDGSYAGIKTDAPDSLVEQLTKEAGLNKTEVIGKLNEMGYSSELNMNAHRVKRIDFDSVTNVIKKADSGDEVSQSVLNVVGDKTSDVMSSTASDVEVNISSYLRQHLGEDAEVLNKVLDDPSSVVGEWRRYQRYISSLYATNDDYIKQVNKIIADSGTDSVTPQMLDNYVKLTALNARIFKSVDIIKRKSGQALQAHTDTRQQRLFGKGTTEGTKANMPEAPVLSGSGKEAEEIAGMITDIDSLSKSTPWKNADGTLKDGITPEMDATFTATQIKADIAKVSEKASGDSSVSKVSSELMAISNDELVIGAKDGTLKDLLLKSQISDVLSTNTPVMARELTYAKDNSKLVRSAIKRLLKDDTRTGELGEVAAKKLRELDSMSSEDFLKYIESASDADLNSLKSIKSLQDISDVLDGIAKSRATREKVITNNTKIRQILAQVKKGKGEVNQNTKEWVDSLIAMNELDLYKYLDSPQFTKDLKGNKLYQIISERMAPIPSATRVATRDDIDTITRDIRKLLKEDARAAAILTNDTPVELLMKQLGDMNAEQLEIFFRDKEKWKSMVDAVSDYGKRMYDSTGIAVPKDAEASIPTALGIQRAINEIMVNNAISSPETILLQWVGSASASTQLILGDAINSIARSASAFNGRGVVGSVNDIVDGVFHFGRTFLKRIAHGGISFKDTTGQQFVNSLRTDIKSGEYSHTIMGKMNALMKNIEKTTSQVAFDPQQTKVVEGVYTTATYLNTVKNWEVFDNPIMKNHIMPYVVQAMKNPDSTTGQGLIHFLGHGIGIVSSGAKTLSFGASGLMDSMFKAPMFSASIERYFSTLAKIDPALAAKYSKSEIAQKAYKIAQKMPVDFKSAEEFRVVMQAFESSINIARRVSGTLPMPKATRDLLRDYPVRGIAFRMTFLCAQFTYNFAKWTIDSLNVFNIPNAYWKTIEQTDSVIKAGSLMDKQALAGMMTGGAALLATGTILYETGRMQGYMEHVPNVSESEPGSIRVDGKWYDPGRLGMGANFIVMSAAAVEATSEYLSETGDEAGAMSIWSILAQTAATSFFPEIMSRQVKDLVKFIDTGDTEIIEKTAKNYAQLFAPLSGLIRWMTRDKDFKVTKDPEGNEYILRNIFGEKVKRGEYLAGLTVKDVDDHPAVKALGELRYTPTVNWTEMMGVDLKGQAPNLRLKFNKQMISDVQELVWDMNLKDAVGNLWQEAVDADKVYPELIKENMGMQISGMYTKASIAYLEAYYKEVDAREKTSEEVERLYRKLYGKPLLPPTLDAGARERIMGEAREKLRVTKKE